METLQCEKKNGVAVVTLNRPSALNAINQQMYLELKDVMDELAEDREIGAVILTGGGEKAFCAGADIGHMSKMTTYESRKFAHQGLAAYKAVATSPKPVIAAVNGLALGGGFEMALACDMIFASEKAKFGLPEINLAIFPGNGGTQRLTRLIGAMKAKELIFTGRTVKAEEALSMGIINRILPPEALMDTAMETAAAVAAKAPVSLHMAKVAVSQALELSLEAGLQYEVECFSALFDTADQKEGMAAFMEKRTPVFRGQ